MIGTCYRFGLWLKEQGERLRCPALMRLGDAIKTWAGGL